MTGIVSVHPVNKLDSDPMSVLEQSLCVSYWSFGCILVRWKREWNRWGSLTSRLRPRASHQQDMPLNEDTQSCRGGRYEANSVLIFFICWPLLFTFHVFTSMYVKWSCVSHLLRKVLSCVSQYWLYKSVCVILKIRYHALCCFSTTNPNHLDHVYGC